MRSLRRVELPGTHRVVGTHESTIRNPGSAGLLERVFVDAAAWCRGRSWWVRLPLLGYLAYVFVRHWATPGEYRSLFDAVNLGIHELGHGLFRPLGEFLTYAGGTIAQCLAPFGAGLMFIRQRDYFGIAVALGWLATNFWDVAAYAGDARALRLALVAPGRGLIPPGEGASAHDWRYMLGELGILPWDETIAAVFDWSAKGTMIVALSFGCWLLVKMATTRRSSV